MDTDTEEIVITQEQTETELDTPWNVIVYDDPVNLMSFVTLIIQRVFGYNKSKAETLMMEVHKTGQSVVWTGGREKAELYVQQLQSYQLLAAMKRAELKWLRFVGSAICSRTLRGRRLTTPVPANPGFLEPGYKATLPPSDHTDSDR